MVAAVDSTVLTGFNKTNLTEPLAWLLCLTEIGRRSMAGAVETGVLGADTACGDELLPESLTRPMKTHSSVAGGDSLCLCKGVERLFGEVYIADDLAIGRLEVLDDLVDALADDLMGHDVGLGLDQELVRPSFQSAIFGCSMTIVVDDGVAQDAIEPGYSRLVAAKLGGLFDGAHVSDLNDVIGGGGSIDTTVQEVEKLLPLAEKVVDGAWGHWRS